MIRDLYIGIVEQEALMMFIIILAFLFTILSAITLLLIGLRKRKRNRNEMLRNRYWDKIKQVIVFLIVKSSEAERYEVMFRRGISVLKGIRQKSSGLNQYILDELIKQKKNLSGDSRQTLLRIYDELDLMSFSRRKLKSLRWKKAAEGIQELEQMEQKDCSVDFYPFLRARNYDVRKAARLGLTSLASHPLHFLGYVNEELSEWEQMAINLRLRKRSKEELPDFSCYFTHSQPSVAAFCIKMCVQFNYFENIPALTQLLFKTKGALLITVVDALNKLEAFQALTDIENLIEQTHDEEVIIAALKFIGKIGDEGSHHIVQKYMEHHEADIRVAAVKAAIKLNMEFESMNEDLRNILYHHKNELIA